LKKICKSCNRKRRIGKFAKDLSRKDNKRIYCRDCIAIINRRYRSSPVGRIKHKKSVDAWKKKNKSAISEYNKSYYKRKRHIILYNKKSRQETESILIVDKFDERPVYCNRSPDRQVIVINPKPIEILN